MQVPAPPPEDSESVGLGLGPGIYIEDPAASPWTTCGEAGES